MLQAISENRVAHIAAAVAPCSPAGASILELHRAWSQAEDAWVEIELRDRVRSSDFPDPELEAQRARVGREIHLAAEAMLSAPARSPEETLAKLAATLDYAIEYGSPQTEIGWEDDPWRVFLIMVEDCERALPGFEFTSLRRADRLAEVPLAAE